MFWRDRPTMGIPLRISHCVQGFMNQFILILSLFSSKRKRNISLLLYHLPKQAVFECGMLNVINQLPITRYVYQVKLNLMGPWNLDCMLCMDQIIVPSKCIDLKNSYGGVSRALVNTLVQYFIPTVYIQSLTPKSGLLLFFLDLFRLHFNALKF